MESTPIYIEILGERHIVTLPGFTEREEVFAADVDVSRAKDPGLRRLRSLAAAIGMCTRIGRRSGASYKDHGFDPLSYGGEVSAWLREQGATPKQIVEAGITIMAAVSDGLYPRAAEVEDEAGKSEGGEESRTASP